MDGAINNGFYGAFTIQVHSDEPADAPGRNALISAAMTRGVPVVSERQLLTWLDGRDSSKFQNVQFGTDGKLRFTVVPGAGANGLEAMIPVQGRLGDLSTLTRNGQSVNYQTQTIKGVNYAVLPDASGDYVASYPAPATAPPATGGTPGGGTTGGGTTGGTTGGGRPAADRRRHDRRHVRCRRHHHIRQLGVRHDDEAAPVPDRERGDLPPRLQAEADPDRAAQPRLAFSC